MKLPVPLLRLTCLFPLPLLADGLVRAPRDYQGSLEERAQEAILIFSPGSETESARQEMILKIRVEGDTDEFAWIVPCPSPPETAKGDSEWFEELFSYVDARQRTRSRGKFTEGAARNGFEAPKSAELAVEVISRDTVGSFDVTVVQENSPNALNGWLEQNGYQPLEGAEETIAFYRESGFVFACIKVSDSGGEAGSTRDLHPLSFSFETRGRDGIFFPMRLTGHQKAHFDVNLYVFYRAWLNDKLNDYGYVYRDFYLNYRDWDTPECRANAGKRWDTPTRDPFLKPLAHKVSALSEHFAEHYAGDRFYLTNLQARNLKPRDIQKWPGDLWLFPYYTNRKFIPYDARPGGPAEKAFAATSRESEPLAANPVPASTSTEAN